MEITREGAIAFVAMILGADEFWKPAQQYVPKDKLARKDLARLERWADKRLLGPERGPDDVRAGLHALAELPDQPLLETLRRLTLRRDYIEGTFELKEHLLERARQIFEHYDRLWDGGTPPVALSQEGQAQRRIATRQWEALRCALWGEDVEDVCVAEG